MTTPTTPPPPPEYGPPIPFADAQRVAAAAEAEARANGWPMTIAVMDSGNNLVLFHKLDNAQLGSIEIAQRKAQTVIKARRPTKMLEDSLLAGGYGMRLLSLDFVLLEGGVPILRDGKLIGAIGVSGMSSAQDGQVAAAGVKALEA